MGDEAEVVQCPFNLLFLKLFEFCLHETYIQSYVLSKLIKNKEKHNNV